VPLPSRPLVPAVASYPNARRETPTGDLPGRMGDEGPSREAHATGRLQTSKRDGSDEPLTNHR